jgi:peroxiredoxin
VFGRLSVLIAITVAGCAAREVVRPTVAASLPAVELVDLQGAPERLEGVLGGRVAVVSLWATWCEACAREFDALKRLAGRAEARGATVVAVAVGEKREHVAEFVKWRGLAYRQLVDEEFHFADALGARRVPATLVVDRDGRILYSGGALDEQALAALRSALDAHVAAR